MLSEVVLAPGSSLGQWQLALSLQRKLEAPLLGFLLWAEQQRSIPTEPYWPHILS
jgi:hypothetical protein